MSINGWRGMLIVAVLGAGLWAGMVGVVSCAVSDDSYSETVVPCPSEDSCAIDYRDGAWHVTKDAP